MVAIVITCCTAHAQGDESRPSRPNAASDPRLVEAQRAMDEAQRLNDSENYAAATPHAERALMLREAVLGPNHIDVAACLNLLGHMAREQAHYELAATLLQKALLIRESVLGSQHLDTVASLYEIAKLHSYRGEYAQSRFLYQQVLSVREASLDLSHLSVAQVLKSLAFCYWKEGDYKNAESFAERALLIQEGNLGSNHPEITWALSYLANIYSDQGDYVRAKPLYERTLKIREAFLGTRGTRHLSVAQALNNLASLYKDQGAFSQAESLYAKSLSIREACLGPNHPDIAQSLNNMANLYKRMDDSTRAESLYQRALAMLEVVFGSKHQEVAFVLANLADLYFKRGAYASAEQLYDRALRIQEAANHPEITDSLRGFARLRLAQNRQSEAFLLLERAFSISETSLRKDALHFSDARLTSFLGMLRDEEELLYALLRRSPSVPQVRRLALTSALLRKGRSTEEIADITRSIYRNLDAADREEFEHLRTLRSQFAALSLDPPKALSREVRRQRLQSLKTQAEAIETDLARRSALLRERTTLPGPADIIDRVAAALPKDGVLIELVAFEDRPIVPPPNAPSNKRPHERRYLALVLLPDGTTHALDLGPVGPIDTAIALLRTALNTPDTAYQPAAEALYHLVFHPIAPFLGTQHRLFICPDGQLNLIPFGALHDGARFLTDTFDWVYLTSGKDLLRRPEARSQPQSIVVLAAPDFNASTPSIIGAASTNSQSGVVRSASLERFFAVARAGYFDHDWMPLSDARKEAEAVQRLFPQAQLLLGSMATKQALLSFPSPGILHIATHGFFIEDSGGGTDSAAPGRGKVFGGSASPRGPIEVSDPLLRSGIILAGANPLSEKNQANPSRFEASVATSLELASLNLWGTQLVVLSACDTGRGEIKLGQGVYGLRRALTIAGAETLVTSLWQVNDETTASLMSDFYQGLRDGQGRAEALRNAMQALRKTHPHPYYWAPFILIGNDAPLRGLTP